MKFLVIFLSFTIMACGGSTTSSTAQDTVPTATKPATSRTNVTQNLKGNYPSEADIKATDTPIYGKGGADFTIEVAGRAPGRADLVGFYAEQNVLVDTTVVGVDGKIKFKKPEGYPQGLYYVSIAKNRYVQVMLDDDQKFTMSTKFSNPDENMIVKGSDSNSALYENILFERAGSPKFDAVAQKIKAAAEGSAEKEKYTAEQQVLTEERQAHLDALYKKHPKSLFTKFKQAGANPEVRTDVPEDKVVFHYRNDFWKGVDFSDRRLLRTPVIHNKLKRYFTELTAQNQDSIYASATRLCDQVLTHPEYYMFFTNWVVRQYEPTKTTLMDPEFVHVKMIQRYFKKDRAFWADSLEVFALQQRAGEMAQSLLGDQGPDVTAKDLNGKTHQLMASKADYLIVYMFAPSCEHCQEQTPLLVDWYNKNKAEGKSRDVYAIALDSNVDDPNELANYIAKTKMPFPCVWDPTNRSIYKRYYVDITPEIYVLDPDRKIIAKNLKVFQIDTMIDRDIEKRNGK